MTGNDNNNNNDNKNDPQFTQSAGHRVISYGSHYKVQAEDYTLVVCKRL